MNNKRWVIAPEIPANLKDQFPEIDPIVLQLLYNRGLKTQKQIDEFLLPDYSQDLHDPFLFKDLEKVVTRIFQAIKNQEKIVVYGDYDADGVTAAAVLSKTLKYLGASSVDIYLPHRELDGYGLNEAAIKKIALQGVKLIITCDCGITNFKEAVLTKSLGIDLIITDHHLPLERLPEAYAIVDPHQDRKYPFKYLAGVGVAFKVAQALLRRASKVELPTSNLNYEAFEKWLLDLVAIGTITDSMPLLGENRTLVKYGLIVLNKTTRLGLRALIKAAGLELGNLTVKNIAYQIGPRLNAAGRLDHANTAMMLLESEDWSTAERLAYELNDLNLKRQQKAEEWAGEIKKKVGLEPKEKIIIECGRGWPLGIAGLVAGKIQEFYYRPTLVLVEKENRISGSGRSVPGLNLVEALKANQNYLERFGGHAMAAGLVLKDKNLFNDFRKRMIDLAEEKLRNVELAPQIFIEAEIDLSAVNWQLIEAIEKFSPFGEANPYPLFLTRNLVVENFSWVGQNSSHLKLLVNGGKKLIFFNSVNGLARDIRLGDKIDVVFAPSTNVWNGNKEIQFEVIDLKLSK
jgi:single-stranded-DNA-specific exonuclease